MTPVVEERRGKRVRCSLPAVLMRSGTSKGLFIHRQNLPSAESDWKVPLLAAMGSRNSDTRQIDGVGGATSTTSKVAVVSPSSRPGVDVDYTFVQVAVGKEAIDLSGNCGNMASGVGPFALQEGLVHARPGEQKVDVHIFNTNTSRLLVETIEVDADGSFNEDGDYTIPGVKGFGSEIKIAFIDPAGSMTGKIFPTGNRTDTIFVKDRNGLHFSVKATLIDVANPFIVVDASSLPHYLRSYPKDPTEYLEHMELIRRTGAVMIGLAPNVQAAAKVRGTPKLAIVSPARKVGSEGTADVHVVAFSMGKPHPSLQLTGAACLASAVCIQGTVAYNVASMNGMDADSLLTPERTPSPSIRGGEGQYKGSSMGGLLPDLRIVRLSHTSGSIDVEVLASVSSTVAVVERCVVSRTARRLFEGKVYYYE